MTVLSNSNDRIKHGRISDGKRRPLRFNQLSSTHNFTHDRIRQLQVVERARPDWHGAAAVPAMEALGAILEHAVLPPCRLKKP